MKERPCFVQPMRGNPHMRMILTDEGWMVDSLAKSERRHPLLGRFGRCGPRDVVDWFRAPGAPGLVRGHDGAARVLAKGQVIERRLVRHFFTVRFRWTSAFVTLIIVAEAVTLVVK